MAHMRGSVFLKAVATALGGMAAVATWAQETRGPITNLPLPRYVSLKASEGNARRGPSLTHRIDWVFKRRDMPLRVTGEYGHWRQVQDPDGATGWMHYSLLSGMRTVIVREELIPIRVRPAQDMPVRAYAEGGVVARLGKCDPEWCRISVGHRKGWVRKTGLWGVEPDELRD